MFRWVVGIAVSIALAMSGAALRSAEKLQDVDTRERLNAASAENAIERVSKEASDKIDRVDMNVQWLIKQQVETTAILRRMERNQ